MTGPDDDEGGNDLAAQVVGLADHSRLPDRWVLHQGTLDLKRPDAIPPLEMMSSVGPVK